MKVEIEDIYIFGMSPAHHPPKLVARIQTTDGPRRLDVEAIQIAMAADEPDELEGYEM